ncbi:MAG: undecaprenyldiphospho-muramoylpentapeptide beta-N-acetylglucosaminyltransferase [Candidatus Methylacidiphilales bacterium]
MSVYHIACGGTGGHFYPGLAIAERLMQEGHEVRLFVSTKKIDADMLSPYSHYSSVKLDVEGWPGLSTRLISFSLKLWKAYGQCCSHIKSEQPVAVLGMGGFSCVPLLLAAKRLGVRAYIHESNAIPGKATRIMAPFMDRVLLGLGSCADRLTGINVLTTGTPVRSTIKTVDQLEARESFAVEDKTVVAVMGGSQGARAINKMVCGTLEKLGSVLDDIVWIHIAGSSEEEAVCREIYSQHQANARVMSYCHHMERVYAASDVVVARAGAATLAECAWFGLPAILVPYPYAAENHQKYNAMDYMARGSGWMVEEGESAAHDLAKALIELLNQKNEWAKRREQFRQKGSDDAVEQIVEVLK